MSQTLNRGVIGGERSRDTTEPGDISQWELQSDELRIKNLKTTNNVPSSPKLGKMPEEDAHAHRHRKEA